VKLLSEGDAEGLWEKLHGAVTHHSAIRSFVAAHSLSRDSTRDSFLDLTQDLFVRLLEKNRWQYYLDAGYSAETIEHELNHLEIPNLISLQLRNRHPETFRIARRISNILKTSSQFKYYGCSVGRSQASGRLVSRIYGLASWFPPGTMKEEAGLLDLIKNVDFRMRETRRSGRGRFSQIIISNKALCQLLVDIFNATQSLMDVRTIRLLALSRVAVEDSRFVSIDEQVVPPRTVEAEAYRIELADKRPTPEEILLGRETAMEVDFLADDLMCRLKQAVRNKPKRFNKLVTVVWHCYFDEVTRSQGEIAGLMGVSDSLVCHYRKLFDSHIRQIHIPRDHWVILNRSIEIRLSSIMSDIAPIQTATSADQETRQLVCPEARAARAACKS